VPEGDTVWLAAKRMDTALGGATLRRGELRVPQLAATDLAGRTVSAVVPRGKHMLTRFTDGWTLRTHYRMDGSWHIYRHGTRWRGGPAFSIRAILATDEWECVGYRLHDVAMVRTEHEDQLVGHLGPDVLGPDWDPAAVRRTLLEQPDRTIGEGLLDQRVLAGVGTFFMAEALFLRGITPWTPVGDVTDLDAVLQLEHRLLSANAARAVQSTTGDLRPGQTQWVHSRSGRPCRRCGTTVRVAMIGPAPQDRTAFYCPRCQRGPAPSDDGRPQQPLGTQPTRLRRSPYRR
jgi:endonuclease-8